MGELIEKREEKRRMRQRESCPIGFVFGWVIGGGSRRQPAKKKDKRAAEATLHFFSNSWRNEKNWRKEDWRMNGNGVGWFCFIDCCGLWGGHRPMLRNKKDKLNQNQRNVFSSLPPQIKRNPTNKLSFIDEMEWNQWKELWRWSGVDLWWVMGGHRPSCSAATHSKQTSICFPFVLLAPRSLTPSKGGNPTLSLWLEKKRAKNI